MGGGDQLTDTALTHLQGLKSLQFLDLTAASRMTSVGLRSLAALSKLQSLKWDAIADEDIPTFASWPQLRHLEIRDTRRLTDQGLATLAKVRPELEFVGFSDGNGGPTLKGLSHFRRLATVSLQAQHLTDETVRMLAEMPSLRELLFSPRVPVAEPFTRIAEIKQLKKYGMEGFHADPYDIPDAEFAKLATLPALEMIELASHYGGGGSPSDAALMHLASAPALRSLTLNFKFRRYTSAGLKAFRDKRPDVHLIADCEDFPGIDFAAERRAAEWVLSVGGTVGLHNEAGEVLPLVDGKLPSQPFTVGGVVCISNQLPVTDTGISHLAGCRRLFNLIVGSNQLTDAGLVHLREMRSLQYLDVNCFFRQTPDGFQHLAKLTRLQVLKLDFLTDENIPRFAHFPELRVLEIRDASRLSSRGLGGLALARPELQWLQLGFDNGEPKLESLRAFHHLESLSLQTTHLTDETVEILKSVKTLREFRIITSAVMPSVFTRSAKISQLKKYAMYWGHTGQFDIPDAEFAQLSTLPALEELWFSGGGGGGGAPTDAALLALTKAPALKTLELHFNSEYRRYTPAGLKAFRDKRPDVHLIADGEDFPPK